MIAGVLGSAVRRLDDLGWGGRREANAGRRCTALCVGLLAAAAGWPSVAQACVPAGTDHLAYSANVDSDTVSVIDTDTDKVVATIGGFDQPWNVSVAADGSKLYVDGASHTDMLPRPSRIWVVDTCTRTVLRTIPTTGAELSALSATGKQLYTAGLFGAGVFVTDTNTDHVVRSFPRSDVIAAQARRSVNDNLIYASGPRYVVRLDADTGKQVGPSLATGLFPAWTSFTPDGRTLITDNVGDGTLTIIDAVKWAVSATLNLGATSAPAWGAGSPDSRTYWNANADGTVSVVDLTTDRVVHKIDAGAFALGVTFDRSGRQAFVTSEPESDTGKMPNGQLGYITTILDVLDPGPGQISVYDTRTYELVARFPTGDIPTPLAIPTGPFPVVARRSPRAASHRTTCKKRASTTKPGARHGCQTRKKRFRDRARSQ
jgi:YVTN family beta-propeller protein